MKKLFAFLANFLSINSLP